MINTHAKNQINTVDHSVYDLHHVKIDLKVNGNIFKDDNFCNFLYGSLGWQSTSEMGSAV